MRQHLRDPVNGGISFAGFLLTVLGTVWMLVQVQGQTIKSLAVLVYGVGLAMTFLASAVHHWVKATPQIELFLLQVDHAMIYLAIAGSYTPVALFLLPDPGRTVLLVLVWLFVLIGFIQKFFFFPVPDSVDDPPDRFSTSLYAVMGLLGLFQIVPLYEAAGTTGLMTVVAGGLFYLVGAFILTGRKLDLVPGTFGHHEIWHLCVLAGSACMFAFIYQTVIL